MKRQLSQRKPSLLDPNVPVGLRNVSITYSNAREDQENQPKRRKQAEDYGFMGQSKIQQVLHGRNNSPKKNPSVFLSSHQSRKESTFILDEYSLNSDYIKEMLETEARLESRSKLSKSFCNNPQFAITPFHREVAIEWLIDMQMYLKVGNDALHLAATLMDLVLDSQKINEDEIQAVAAASMWLAYKFFYGGIKAKLILKYCMITLKDLVLIERRILRVARMNLTFTNPMTILNWQLYNIYGKEIPCVNYHMSNYLLEIMLLVVDFAGESIIKRATVAVETTRQLLGSRVGNQLLSPGLITIQRRLLSSLRTIWNKSDFREDSSLYRKYSTPQCHHVSLHSCLNPDFFDT